MAAKKPAAQLVHAVAATPLYSPELHLAHAARLLVAPMVPELQFVHALAPAAAYWPELQFAHALDVDAPVLG